MTVTDRPVTETEVLIAEARERARRRRRWSAALVSLVVLGAVGVRWGTSGDGTGSTLPATRPAPHRPRRPARPVVNPAVLRGRGTLAFISRGSLWLTSAASGLRELLPATQHPSHPVFSADGRWLEVTTAAAGQHVWVARDDGRRLHELPWRSVSVDGWSPRGHTLAVGVWSGRDASALTLVTPANSDQRRIARVRGDYGAVWSPDGRSLAVSAINQPAGRTTIRTYPVKGGAPTTWFSAGSRHGRLDGMNSLRLQPAGWWTGQGIGFWVYGDGAVSNNDQSPLYVLAQPGAPPRLLGSTLTNRAAPSVTGSRSGRLAIVAETRRQGFGRLVWQDKNVAVCPPQAAPCHAITTARRSVTLDPAWSPNGRSLAYIEAPARNSTEFPQHVVRHWYAAHRLIIYNAATGTHHAVRNSNGVTAPRWSSVGHDLLYEANDALWLLRPGAREPRRIVTPLYPRASWPAYYGQIDWIGQYAWSDAA
jgi:WD40-like Beta Propeller Repeat